MAKIFTLGQEVWLHKLEVFLRQRINARFNKYSFEMRSNTSYIPLWSKRIWRHIFRFSYWKVFKILKGSAFRSFIYFVPKIKVKRLDVSTRPMQVLANNGPFRDCSFSLTWQFSSLHSNVMFSSKKIDAEAFRSRIRPIHSYLSLSLTALAWSILCLSAIAHFHFHPIRKLDALLKPKLLRTNQQTLSKKSCQLPIQPFPIVSVALETWRQSLSKTRFSQVCDSTLLWDKPEFLCTVCVTTWMNRIYVHNVGMSSWVLFAVQGGVMRGTTLVFAPYQSSGIFTFTMWAVEQQANSLWSSVDNHPILFGWQEVLWTNSGTKD